MKQFFICLSLLGVILATNCGKEDESNGGNEGTLILPILPDPDDICSCMDDPIWKQYCYDNSTLIRMEKYQK